MTRYAALSNGRYHATLSAAGGGCSQLGVVQLTRWRQDLTTDADGWFLYLRDLDSGAFWSAGHMPVQRPADRYEVQLGGDRAVITREDAGVVVRTDVVVAHDANLECRRYTITNNGTAHRRIQLTTYAAVALATADADAGHPAFSKLFIQTSYVASLGAIVASRRPRGADERPVHLIHALLAPQHGGGDAMEVETDRMRFIGRGRSTANPAALDSGHRLSGTTGDVLDPVVALRRVLELSPGASVQVHALLAAGPDRDALEQLIADTATDGAASLFHHLGELPEPEAVTFAPLTAFRPAALVDRAAPTTEPLEYFNGFGGFTADGREYVIRMDSHAHGLAWPPLPWANVIASETAGFVATEAGPGFTWRGNSRLNRLTPWSNDPVCDPQGEAIYIRDDEHEVFWSPTPAPVPGSGAYEVRHGFGATTWRHPSADLDHEVTAFVTRDTSAKVIRFRLTNSGATARRLTLFCYAEWVLGGDRRNARGEVSTALDDNARVLLATRPTNPTFPDAVAFATVTGPGSPSASHTSDRVEFLGEHGSVRAPRAVAMPGDLSGRIGDDLDPCAAFQLAVSIGPGECVEWSFVIGQADDVASALAACAHLATPEQVADALTAAQGYWTELLGGVQVDTPSRAMNLMLNGWLAYQNLSCRIWARSAFYQSGGAYGYRDQLQDSSAMVYLAPAMMRGQLLRNAAHQFIEGDVLHWWHPPASIGIRTRFSDDLVWLPYLLGHYLDSTGDTSILDEELPYLDAPPVPTDEDEILVEPERSNQSGTVYEHCCRALDRSLTTGEHGLPLIGSGDWNDGMNRVGRLGRGESVWMGFFLYLTLERFIRTCLDRGDRARAERYRAYRAALEAALNSGGWDGAWYRRAYYDNGEPLGTAAGDECRIDLIAQAWAVMSGAAPPERARLALDAMEAHLVDEHSGLIRLLTPPFDATPNDPGYIKGYLPGVRENGGQYTHAALWAIRALAEAGRTSRAFSLFEMIMPVTRGATAAAIHTYMAEPYVVAADVYGMAPHVGRGGWTWYTGSAGWMYRIGLESLLGVTVSGSTLVLRPSIPPEWPGYTVRIRPPGTRAECVVEVVRASGPTMARSEGSRWELAGGALRLPMPEAGVRHFMVLLGDDIRAEYRPRPAAEVPQ